MFMAATACPGRGLTAPDNFEPLRSLDWQAHVYGEADREISKSPAASLIYLCILSPGATASKEAGLKRDALYLVRPDGYVALASSEQERQ